mmetsp:Transcript_1297/g.3621  ORF Transcript_1297/g.3621 Transcript_1297/m.3621 type:complete len:142 (-) Transcript_1297:13-438(-)
MKSGMTRWKMLPLNPYPFSPVANARKFSAVLGTTSFRSSMTIRPSTEPPISMSKKTLGLLNSSVVRLKARTAPGVRKAVVARVPKAAAVELDAANRTPIMVAFIWIATSVGICQTTQREDGADQIFYECEISDLPAVGSSS